jgi:hypothetical protein
MAEIIRACTSLPLAFGIDETEDADMFTVHCPQHGREVLLSERRIESLHNTLNGIEIRWVCWCGTRGSMLTGRLRRSSQLI